jgi:hypothetical protein
MTLLLKITLSYTAKPPVWRELLIDESEHFATLHQAIQNSFGWFNSHLWEFSPKPYRDPRMGPPADDMFGGDFGEPVEDASKVLLSSVFEQPKDDFSYVYDMGDGWEHQIVLEKIVDTPAPFPQCTAGQGACPPEDCGGVPGYYRLVEAINNPKHPEHEDMMDWLEMEKGEQWDVHAFDLEATQAVMKKRSSKK